MIWSADRATSFRDAIRYVLHDKGADTSNRVGMVQLDNLAFDPDEMEVTFRAATALQAREREIDGKRSGASGRHTTKPVYHLSLSWHPDDQPSPEHMLETARAALRHLGLQDHQALIVEHTDRPHRHVHIIVNLAHPDTGRCADLFHDRHNLERWAHEYESRNQIRVFKRAAKMDQKHRTENVSQDPAADKIRADRAREIQSLQLRHTANRLHRQQQMELTWAEYDQKKKSVEELYAERLHQLRVPKSPNPTFDLRPPRGPRKPAWMQVAEAMRPFLDRLPLKKGLSLWKPDQEWSPDRTANVLSGKFKTARRETRLLPPERQSGDCQAPLTRQQMATLLRNARTAELASLARAHQRHVQALEKADADALKKDEQERKQFTRETAKIWMEFHNSQAENAKNDNLVVEKEPVKEEFIKEAQTPAASPRAPQYQVRVSQTEAENQFGRFIREQGFDLKGPPIMDGRWHNIAVAGQRNKAGGYRGFFDNNSQGYVKNHKDPGRQYPVWRPEGERVPLTAEQGHLFAEEASAKVRARDAALKAQHDNAASLANIRWIAAEPASREHPYLVKKGIERHGIRQTDDGKLLIPRYNKSGELRAYQTIAPDGEKKYQWQGEIKGAFHIIGDPSRGGPIVINEGFATGATTNEASNCAVYVAFDKNNLREVARIVREIHPDRDIVIGADNDAFRFSEKGYELAGRPDKDNIPGDDPRWDEWRKAGHLENAGVIVAQEAAREIGATVIVPDFTGLEHSKPTDFNDLANLKGEAAVRSYFQKEPEKTVELEQSYGYDR